MKRTTSELVEVTKKGRAPRRKSFPITTPLVDVQMPAPQIDSGSDEDISEETEIGDPLERLSCSMASVWLPSVLRFMSFKEICRAGSVCSTWHEIVYHCDPEIMTKHLQVAIKRHLKINSRDNIAVLTPPTLNPISPAMQGVTNRRTDDFHVEATKMAISVCHAISGNSQLLKDLRIAHELAHICTKHPHGTNYAAFLRRCAPVAHGYFQLATLLPKLFHELEKCISFCDLSVSWHPSSDLVDVANFSLALVCALGILCSEGDIKLMKPLSHPLHLSISFRRAQDFGIFMDPLKNTVHASSIDSAFLTEQLRNATRSLCRFNEIVGYIDNLSSLEKRVISLLELKSIERDPDIEEEAHAHCLFKLALYYREINGGLRGATIMPSKAFEMKPTKDGCLIRFLWCASWLGNDNRNKSIASSSSSGIIVQHVGDPEGDNETTIEAEDGNEDEADGNTDNDDADDDGYNDSEMDTI